MVWYIGAVGWACILEIKTLTSKFLMCCWIMVAYIPYMLFSRTSNTFWKHLGSLLNFFDSIILGTPPLKKQNIRTLCTRNSTISIWKGQYYFMVYKKIKWLNKGEKKRRKKKGDHVTLHKEVYTINRKARFLRFIFNFFTIQFVCWKSWMWFYN